MEVINTTKNGTKINILYTGEKYYFLDVFFGFTCIAQRIEDNNFILFVGNSRCSDLYNKDIVTIAKKIINKKENQYIYKKIKYTIKTKDLNNISINISDNLQEIK